MNAKLILVGSGAALVPVVAVPTALSLSNNTSTEKAPELSVSERPPVPHYPPHPPLTELRKAPVSQPDKFPPSPFPDSVEVESLGSFSSVSDSETPFQNTHEFILKHQNLAKPLKDKLSAFGSSFDHKKINNKKGSRSEQFKSFVEQTDQLRNDSKQAIKEFLNKEEFKDKDFQTIFGQYLMFELLSTYDSKDYYNFANLSFSRESEVEAQMEKDKSKENTPTRVGTRIQPEDIINFCKDPSAANSHLGVYSSSRKDEEETKEYRFFTYYSYCQKGSFYLNKDLRFDSLQTRSI